MELGLVIARGEVNDAKHLGLQGSDSVDDQLNIGDWPSFQCSGGRVKSHIV